MSTCAKLALFGCPIEHSLSPLIHQHFAKLTNKELSYTKILVNNNFASLVRDFFNAGALGCNVTVPCKIDAFKLCDELSSRAQIARAVNTIVRKDNGDGSFSLYGDNTDGYGFLLDLERLNCPLKDSNILLLGTGGAARGLIEPLLKAQAKLTICGRELNKDQDLAHIFSLLKCSQDKIYPIDICSYQDFMSNGAYCEHKSFNMIINTTSLSMEHKLPLLANKVFHHCHCVYDLFYTPSGHTVFTLHAQNLGVPKVYDGLGMLIGQALLAYEAWFKIRPDFNATLDYMRQVLSAKI